MMTFFYDAHYPSGTGPAEVLHAQVCTLGDKYICQALFDYAEAAFSQILRHASYTLTADWVKLGTLVYDFLSTDLPSHMKMRHSVVFPINHYRLDKMTEIQEVRDFLKTQPLAAVDVLFEGQKGPNRPVTQLLFKCPHCTYAHDGPYNCSFLSLSTGNVGNKCPKCGNPDKWNASLGVKISKLSLDVRCGACGGMHNING
jgi:hypothetical protein